MTFVFFKTWSQSKVDEDLAYQFYHKEEYEKASILLEKLFKKNTNSTYYSYLLDSYLKLNDFKNAEKIVKKQQIRFPGKIIYFVDLGVVFELSGNQKKADKEFDKAIKSISGNAQEIIQLADAFKQKGKLDLAIETYDRGRKVLNNSYPFAFERGEIYLMKRDIPMVIDIYLDVLKINRAYLQQVQNALQGILNDDPNLKRRELLKSKLLNEIQGQKNEIVFSELLIWLFMQEKDFEGAFIQAKALDKRNKEDGRRVFNLAKIADDNLDYTSAILCYKYVVSKGEDFFYYVDAKMKLVQTMSKQIIDKGNYVEKDLYDLEKQYFSTIAEIGSSYKTIELTRDLAHLQAFYLHKMDSAIVLLEKTIKTPRARKSEIAKCKLELGDILVFQGDIWEAVLYYGQVETDYKHDVLGHEAKFRKARVYYYSGDFAWAKTQLDVLKSSTSKLIANDALSLSLIISDNTGLDTNEIPVQMFAQADLLFFQKQFNPALLMLDSILKEHPSHVDIKDDIYYMQAQIAYEFKEYDKCITLFDKVIQLNTSISDDALFSIAKIYEFRLNDLEKAKEAYKKVLLSYSGSVHSIMARKRFRYLRGDFGDEEILLKGGKFNIEQ